MNPDKSLKAFLFFSIRKNQWKEILKNDTKLQKEKHSQKLFFL